MWAYFLLTTDCHQVIKDAQGKVTELRCSLDPDTLGKNPPGRKVKGVIHWVSAEHALAAEIRLYDRLFTVARPDTDKERDFHAFLNPDSLAVVQGWIDSPGHCANLMRSSYKELGAAKVSNPSSTYKVYWTQVLGKSR